MDFRSISKKVITTACIWFTFLTAIYSFIVLIVTVDSDDILVDAGRIVLFFVFSLLMSIADAFLKIKSLGRGVRYTIHFIISIFAAYSSILLPASLEGSRMIVGIIVFLVVYAIVMSLRAFFLSRYTAKAEVVEEYKSMFSGANSEVKAKKKNRH